MSTDTDLIVPLDVAQKLLDIAVSQAGFESGHLDDEETEAMRAFATLLGVDPWDATPPNHRPKYCPGHQWTDPLPWAARNGVTRCCTVCGLDERT